MRKKFGDELEDRYDQTNGAKLFQLQCEINELNQENLDVTGFYTRIRKLWEELSALDTNSRYTCMCTCSMLRFPKHSGINRESSLTCFNQIR